MVYAYPDKESFPNCELSSVENLTVIRNTSIFKLMFRSLAFAPHAPPSATTGLFSVLDLLLNPKHSNLNINVEQLMSIEILNILMWLLKVSIIVWLYSFRNLNQGLICFFFWSVGGRGVFFSFWGNFM